MSTSSQISANRANSQHSTGPKTAEGKAASSRNNTAHGLAGEFHVLPWESQELYDGRLRELREELQPSTSLENTFVDRMAEHEWLRQRAMTLQGKCFDPETGEVADAKQFTLYLRYQTTHERAFHKCFNDLLKLRAEKRKEQIGFESQKRKDAEEQRYQDKHAMKKRYHEFDVLLAEARVDHQMITNLNIHEPGKPLAADARAIFEKTVAKLEAVSAA
ncbi:MAG TPA: hypothetical protein VGL97_08300 [Bryobacteraceae bacterium]|jgi:hypothetical protein